MSLPAYTAEVTFHTLHLTVYGNPTPQGSKHVVRGILLDTNKDRLRTWREDVKLAGLAALADCPQWDRTTPCVLGSFVFTFRRPKHHHVAGDPARELRDNAPRMHTTRPDLDKLLRSTWDALGTAGVFHDDCRVAQVFATKVYVDPHGAKDMPEPGARITLTASRP